MTNNNCSCPKYYLLIAGIGYYPDLGTGDWVDTFSSEEEAKKALRYTESGEVYTRGYKKGQKIRQWEYLKNGNWHKCDWHEIVNLQDWINK